MSRETVEVVRCDEPAPHECGDARTLTVALDGQEWESDRCTAARFAIEAGLSPFIDAARKTGRVKGPHRIRTAAERRHAAEVRAWAREQGIEVGDKGSFPKTVMAAWRAAHGAGGRNA